jgi:hypothetical protein
MNLKLIDLLHKIRVEETYFESHIPEEFQNIKTYKNYSEEEFVQFILKNSKLNKPLFIGTAQDGRKILKLFRLEEG